MTCLPPGSSTQMPDRCQTKGPPGADRSLPTPARGAPEMLRGLFGPRVSSRHPKPVEVGADVCDEDAGYSPKHSVMEVRSGELPQAV